uniref:Uncharacterized protein n=1 Tax=Lepeophtheirus salmonis TaxID=72036 RepID=A0A0K2UDT0_LEPSM
MRTKVRILLVRRQPCYPCRNLAPSWTCVPGLRLLLTHSCPWGTCCSTIAKHGT